MAPGKRRKDDDEEFEAPAPKASRDSPEVSRKLKYQAQITGLNQQHAEWVASQLANNPQMLWVPGAKDYVKHVERIQQEFKDVLDAARQFPSGTVDNGDHAVGTGGASGSGWGAGGSSGNGGGLGSATGFGGSGARTGGSFGLPPPSFGSVPAASTGDNATPSGIGHLASAQAAFGNYNGPFGATTTDKAAGAAAQADSRGDVGGGGQKQTGTTTTPTPSFFGLGSAQPPAASGPSSTPAFGSFHFKSATTEAGPASAAANDSSTTETTPAAFGSTAIPTFGATAATTFGASPAPAFGSLTSSTTAAPAFGSTAPSAFGLAGAAPTSGTTAAPTFGSTAASTFGTSTTPAFGSAAATTFGTSTAPAFGAPAAAKTGADAAAGTAASTGTVAAPSTSIWPVITGGAFTHASDSVSASTTAAAAAEAAAMSSKGSEGKGSEGSTSGASTKTLFNFGAKSAMPQPTFGPTAGGFNFSWPGSAATPSTGTDTGALAAAAPAANPEEGEEEGPQKYESEVEINQDSGTVHFKAKSKFFVMKESAWEMMGVGQLMVRSPVPNPDKPDEPAKSPFITFTTEGGRVLFCANLYKNMKLIINEAKNTVSWAAPWKPPGAKEGGSALSNVMAQLPKGHYSKISEEITKLQAAMA